MFYVAMNFCGKFLKKVEVLEKNVGEDFFAVFIIKFGGGGQLCPEQYCQVYKKIFYLILFYSSLVIILKVYL